MPLMHQAPKSKHEPIAADGVFFLLQIGLWNRFLGYVTPDVEAASLKYPWQCGNIWVDLTRSLT